MSVRTPDTAGRTAPVVLVPDDAAMLATTRTLAQMAGRYVTTGWRLPDSPWDLTPHAVVVSGTIGVDAGEDDLVDAVVRGAGAIIAVATSAPRPTRLIDAIQRVTPVVDGLRCRVLRLDTVQLELLAELARGASTRDAASACYLSVRTAHRRIADARATLGVGSTNAAAAELTDALRFWAP